MAAQRDPELQARRPLRVLIVCDWFIKLVVVGQARALRELGHEVAVLCRSHALEFGNEWEERERILAGLRRSGVAIFELTGRRYGPEGLLPAERARRQVRRWAPDVISAHENSDPRLWLASLPRPIIYTVHDPEPHPGAHAQSPGERLSGALWLRTARRIVVQGPQLIAQLPRGVSREKVSVVAHGIDVADKPMPIPKQPKILLFGRLEEYKGIPVLVQAMRHVWRQRPDVTLVVAGRGRAARDLPANGRIDLRERYIPEEEVPRILGEATVSVLPYTQASQSGVGLLSIAHGIPTVVTRVGALPEIAVDEGYVARPGDPESLASCLMGALDGTEAERRRIHAFARDKFDWSRVAQSYIDVCREVLRLD